MRILALETSTLQGSVALLEQSHVVSQTTLPADRRTTQSLAPAMDQLLRHADWSPGSVQMVALTNGPGSFTGLRIAVTTAKTFAFATHARIVAVDTLRVLAAQLPDDVQHACAMMDAQRRQLFVATFQRDQHVQWQTVRSCEILHREQLAELLPAGTVLTGPALARLPSSFLADHPRAALHCWTPRAGTVGQLAWHAFKAGHCDGLLTLQPRYYRPSYAEEKSS